MKKIIFFLSLFISTGIFSGCNDFLDKQPDDAITLEMVFNDKTRTEEWLAAIYSDIEPDPLMDYTRQWGCTFLSDDAQIAIAMGQFNQYWEFITLNNQGGMNPTYTPPINIWKITYQAIRSAYIFMENVKPLTDQGITSENVLQMKMEARFLIALGYAKILELYGPCPLITELMPSDLPIESMMLSRTPYDEMVEWLDNEFRELADFFPGVYANPDQMFGRPTKGICLALRARMWLYAASPLYNGNPDFADLVNRDGTPIFNPVYDNNKWKKAADATRELLDLAESGVYRLYTETYTNGEIDPFLSCQNLFLKSGNVNKEIIFPRYSASHLWYNKVGSPRGFVGESGYYGSTQNLVDAFHMKNGLVPILGYESDGSPIINPQSGYTETGFTTTDIIYANTAYNLNSKGAAGLITEAGTFIMYANREPRFYTSLWHDNQYIPMAGRYTEFKSGGLDGGPTHDSPQSGYLVRKGVNPEGDPRNSNVPYQPGIVLRLGEFYLNYAEALNEYDPDGGRSEILKYMNLIRERGGIPIYGNGADEITPPTGQDEMREAIRRERRVEFAVEGDIRYNDLRRWKIGVDVFSSPITGMNRTANNNDFYKRTVYMTRQFEKKSYFWPIHQDYLDNNPNLVQNKFW